MKYVLSILQIVYGVIICYGQSKYDFPTGFDSLAYSQNIKSKSTYFLFVDSTGIDTNTLEIHSYDTLGFLTSIEIRDLHNMRRDPSRSTFFHKNTAKFQYNELGYLIDEIVNWSGPVGWWGKDTIRKRKIEDWAYIKHSEILLYTETINNYPEEDEWIEKCDYFYFPDNRIDSVVCFTIMGIERFRNVTTYRYNDLGLLIAIEYKNKFGIYRQTLVRYEFYD